MLHNIRDLAVFEKLASVSRASSTFELLWYLDLEITPDKTVVNALFRNTTTGEHVIDSIAPEYIGYCSVGSFFRGGKKMVIVPPKGVVRDITIDVPEETIFRDIGSAISPSEYDLSFAHATKQGQSNYSYVSKKQKCMVFSKGSDKIVIPCCVIAGTYYLLSHSMRVQLFAQNIHGLYEAFNYDEQTDSAAIIMHRNGRTEDARHIARFARSSYSGQCWENVMNGIRATAYTNHAGREYFTLVAPIPVVQNNLLMRVRCHEAPNPDGGATYLVHEIIRERSVFPFKTLYLYRRKSATPDDDTKAKTELDAKSDGMLTNKPPSKAYTNHQVKHFNVPDNPLWHDIILIQVDLPPRQENAELMTVREETDDSVQLSSQRAKGDDPVNKVARSSLDQKPPKKDPTPRMALAEFSEMVAGFEAMEGVTELFVSSELAVPLKKNESRSRLTMRESYDGDVWSRRHYMYATFMYGGMSVCLVEIDQSGLSTHVGTFVLVAQHSLGEAQASIAANDFVCEKSIGSMATWWEPLSVFFDTKSHPPNNDKEHWGSWRDRVLEMVG
jgi:hypothetical protein